MHKYFELSSKTTRNCLQLSFLACTIFGATAGAQTTSELWGTNGENWTKTSRLPDFSIAGYQERNQDLPTHPIVTNVKNYGAVGDGITDDSNAFIQAIEATNNGALLIPAGKYKITKVLQINKSNLTLRGEGPSKSILYFPQPLLEVASQYGSNRDWPYKGGFVWIQGQQEGQAISPVIASAPRGSSEISVASTANIQIGQYLRLVQLDDSNQTLMKSMQGGIRPQSDQVNYLKSELTDTDKLVDWMFKVVAIDGNKVTLDRPLRTDIDLIWQPKLYSHNPTVKDVGVEGLDFQFLGRPKKAHNSEEGFNAIFLKNVTNGWVRNVVITDADYGVNARAFVYNSQFEDITIRSVKRSSSSDSCHHGLSASILSQDNLFNRFNFETKCVHDLTVEAYASGNVFSNGYFVRATIDHHKAAPYENLFTNFSTRDGSRLYQSGGGYNRGPQAGVRETFWNIKSMNKLQALPSISQYPQMNVVGLAGYATNNSKDRWVEVVADTGVTPENIYEAQFSKTKNVYEAETAKLQGAVTRTVQSSTKPKAGNFSGSGYVDFVNLTGDFVEFTIDVPATGSYQLVLKYANGGTTNRTLQLSVNGVKSVGVVNFSPTGSRQNWNTVSYPASLPAGKSIKIRLTSIGMVGPGLDSLNLIPL